MRPVYTEQERFGDAIEIIDAKHNDRKGFAPVAIELDPKTMLYHVLANFDHDAVQAAWEAMSKGKVKSGISKAEQDAGRKAAKAAEEEKEIAQLDSTTASLFKESPGYWDSTTFKALLMERSGLPKQTVETYIKKRVEDWKNGVGDGLKIAEQKELVWDAKTNRVKEGTSRSKCKLLKGSPEAITRYVEDFKNRHAKT